MNYHFEAIHVSDFVADVILQFDGTPIAADDVADLSVTVVSAEVQPATSIGEFPKWSSFEKLTCVTRGKPGGYR